MKPSKRAVLPANSKKEPVARDALEKIVEAGRLAPCGGNSQSTRFIVIQNGEALREIAELACNAFAQMEITDKYV